MEPGFVHTGFQETFLDYNFAAGEWPFLTSTTLLSNSADDKLVNFFFLFFPENRNQMSNPVFWGKNQYVVCWLFYPECRALTSEDMRLSPTSDIYAQRRFRSDCAFAQSDLDLHLAHFGYPRTQSFFMWTTKNLIRLRGCTGWFESLWDVHVTRYVFSRWSSVGFCISATMLSTSLWKSF